MSSLTSTLMFPLRRSAAASGALALAALGVLGGAHPAAAGTNGQQIVFHDSRGTVWSVRIKGTNQDGQYAEQCFNTNHTDTCLSGWWWKGRINVTGYTAGECTSGAPIAYIGEVDVPTYQANSDWFRVSG
ncbi:hypothetical protein ACPB9E_35745 [Streptomyces exfoliatus]|uniref:hypothetical protein n=1 Tax=Streptomyces exfoliatus TaxID=1905 RepID=UPI003C30820A